MKSILSYIDIFINSPKHIFFGMLLSDLTRSLDDFILRGVL